MSNFTSAQFDAAAVSRAKHLPVESAMPGTTLQIIPLEAFESGGVLYGRQPSQLACKVSKGISTQKFHSRRPKYSLNGMSGVRIKVI